MRFWEYDKNSRNGERWAKSHKFNEACVRRQASDRKYRESNADKLRERSRRYRASNSDKVRSASRARYAANAEVERARVAQRYNQIRGIPIDRSPEQRQRQHQNGIRYRARHAERLKARRGDRYLSDALYALTCRLRGRTVAAFRLAGYRKTSRTAEMLGCDWETAKAHIESRFTEGMTWENRSLWHIDHIIPLASAKTEEELVALCHHTNLQPLWATDNLRKSNKLPA
jgi:hypothetical protein